MKSTYEDDLSPGSKVFHPKLGLGKIVHRDSDLVRIYFKSADEPIPDRRIRQFRLPNAMIRPAEDIADVELDNLPPWSDGRLQQFQTSMTLDSAKKLFLHYFPEGFDDPGFYRHELDYKHAAHRRFREQFLARCRGWIAAGDAAAIAHGLNEAYGDPKIREGAPDVRLNILYQRAEEPAYFDALAAGGPATVAFADAVLRFIESGDQTDFERYAESLANLPTRVGGMRVDGWTCATWLPFIAAPDRNIVIKPTIIRAFASSLAFEINYRSQVNFQTYRRVVDMSLELQKELERSELNLRKRPLNLIDVQSFMWAVERYGKCG